MLIPHSIIGFTEASDNVCCFKFDQCVFHYFEVSRRTSRCCLKSYQCSEVKILSVHGTTSLSPSPLAHQHTKAFFLLFLPQCFKGSQLSENIWGASSSFQLLPAIWGYYWGSLVPRYWSLVSLKWLPAAAGIFCSACDVFGSKWNNGLKTSFLRAVDTSSVSLRFKQSSAGCNSKTHTIQTSMLSYMSWSTSWERKDGSHPPWPPPRAAPLGIYL